MKRHKDEFEWFDLSNYLILKKFRIDQWQQAIEWRMLFCRLTITSGDIIKCDPKDLSKIGGVSLAFWQEAKWQGAAAVAPWFSGSDENKVALSGAELTAAVAKYGRSSVMDLTGAEAMEVLGDRYGEADVVKDTSVLFGITEGEYMPDKYAIPLGDSDRGLLEVDLSASDEQIKQNFDAWLCKVRELYSRRRTSRITKRDFDDWEISKVVPCFDLMTISEIEGRQLSNHHLGDLLFPDEVDVDVSERVRKITKVKTRKVFSKETSDVLSAQILEMFKPE